MSDKQERHEENEQARIEHHDTEDLHHCQESESKDQQGSEQETQTIASKEEAVGAEETDPAQQEATTGADSPSLGSDTKKPSEDDPSINSIKENDACPSGTESSDQAGSTESRQCSCSYTPPYYVPNFTKAQGGSANAAAATKRSRAGTSAVAIILIISVLLTFSAVSLSGYWLARSRRGTTDGEDVLNVIKNNGSIKVNEKIDSTGYSNLSVSEVVELVADSVVEITTSQVQFTGSYVTSGAGSGVLIGERPAQGWSYIITNQHVIEDADQITVRLKNGTEYRATLVCGDADVDIAVLTIAATGLSYATMGSSASLKVGEEVVAIGNPLGELGGTVTNGIISALDRNIIVDDHPMTLLQTNAAINPGNSGGGLFNMAGELIGIVNAKQSDTGIEGLGFAIPVDVAWSAADDMIRYGLVTGKLVLGFTVVGHTKEFRYSQGVYSYTFPSGVYVEESERSDLKYYDRIDSINGETIDTIADFYTVVYQLNKGDQMTVVVSRLSSSGKRFQQYTVTVEVAVTEAPGT